MASSLSAIKSDISTLSSFQLTELFEYIGQFITINSMEKTLHYNCGMLRSFKYFFLIVN
ncbi:MAG: hypothetical protein E6600_13930 [Anaerocolumna aminovalerica]|uniref:hypothetical protein n=1 Tax=Anaerocolumna aminovalerica TaxID=1527 RepID=UPI0029149975|nr:hypothetical protein [Anaerocolumna aminovalerica]MDU6265590.1 hypothetical protein [Anaerocolumna aminovalerica]